MPHLALPPELQNLNLNPQQIAALLSHLQAGSLPFLPPPPPPPPSSFAPAAPLPPLPFPPSLPPASNGQGLYASAGPMHYKQEKVSTSMHGESYNRDMTRSGNGPARTSSATQVDREDGELSDGNKPTLSSHPASSGSKKRKLAASSNESRRTSHRPAEYSGTQHNGHSASRQALSPEGNAFYRASRAEAPQSLQHKKSLALPLLAALHDEGFTFDEFVQEGFDEAQLRTAYDQLKISIHPAAGNKTVLQGKTDAHDIRSPPAQASIHSNDQAVSTSSKMVEPSVAKPPSSVNIPTAAKPAPALTRQDYLARLQAAKTKKQGIDAAKQASSSVSSPKPVGNVTPPVIEAVAQPLISSDDKMPVAVPSSKQAQLTELARKKMEALKAMQRRMANKTAAAATATPATPLAASRTGVSKSPVPTSTNGAGISRTSASEISQTLPRPIAELARAPNTAGQEASSGGIPGLYMPSASSKSHPVLAQTSSNVSSHVSDIATTTQQADVSAPSTSDSSPAPGLSSYFPAGIITTSARKRPVASDLNEAYSAPDVPRYTRPFGQSRRNSSDDAMIIEVSEDEGTNAAEDLTTTTNTAANSSAPRQLSIRDLPPLRDFPPRLTLGRPPGLSIPSVGTPGTASDTEELRRKEEQIAALNNKIQEMQKRKTALKANGQAGQSLPQTPAPASPLVSKAQTTQVLASLASGQQAVVHSSAVAATQQPTIISCSSPVDKRSKIQAAITARDIDIKNQKAKIMEMQRQISQMQCQFEEDMQKQEELREELESLDIDTEGMTQSEMQAKKDEIDRNLQDDQPQPADGGDARSLDSEDESSSEFQPEDALAQMTTNGTNSYQQPVSHVESSSEEEGEVSEAGEGDMDISQSSPAEYIADQQEEIAAVITTDDQSLDNAEVNEPARLHIGNLPFNITKEELTALFSTYDTTEIHLPMKNGRPPGYAFVSLPLHQAVTVIDQLNSLVIHGRKINVQMARPRGPPAGTPVKAATPAAAESPEESNSDAEMDTDSSEDEEESAEGDDVETGEEVEGSNVNETDRAGTTSPSPSDMSISSESDVDDQPSQPRPDLVPTRSTQGSTDSDAIPSTISAQPFSQHRLNGPEQSNTDDLASELQPALEQQIAVNETVGRPQGKVTSADKLQQYVHPDTPAQPTFKPYESVLKKFRKYRFHPDFLETVPGGFRSMSFSNRIDPQKPLCRFEVASGVCNDPDCQSQHFREMSLTGAS